MACDLALISTIHQMQNAKTTEATAATFVQPSLQLVQDAQALVQLLFDHVSHVVVDFACLQHLLEGLVQLLQLLTLQGSKPTTLLDLLPQL